MLILAFDTTSTTLSVALLDEKKIVAKSTIFESGKQSELLIPEIEKILHKKKIWYQDLDLIAATKGPGSFTGSRIGLTAARTLEIATNVPVILVNSCEVIAFKYKNFAEKILVILDGGVGDFFCAKYFSKEEKFEQILPPYIARQEQLLEIVKEDNFFICGSGQKMISSHFKMSKNDDILEADLVGKLALKKFYDKDFSENKNPIYLRAPKIEMRKK